MKNLPPKFIAITNGIVLGNVEGFSITKHLYGIKTGQIRSLSLEYKKELFLRSPFDSPVGHLSLRCVTDQRLVVRPGSPILLVRRVDDEDVRSIVFSTGRLPVAFSLNQDGKKFSYYPIFVGVVVKVNSRQVSTPVRTNYNFNIEALDLSRLLTKTSVLSPVLMEILEGSSVVDASNFVKLMYKRIYDIDLKNSKDEFYRHEFVKKILEGYARNVQKGSWSDFLLGRYILSSAVTAISSSLKGNPLIKLPIGMRRKYFESHKSDKFAPASFMFMGVETPWSVISDLKLNPWIYEAFIREDTGDFVFRLNRTLQPNAWLLATTNIFTRALSYFNVSLPNIGFLMDVAKGYVNPNVVYDGDVHVGRAFMHSIEPHEVKGTALVQSNLSFKSLISIMPKITEVIYTSDNGEEKRVLKTYISNRRVLASTPKGVMHRYGNLNWETPFSPLTKKLYDESQNRPIGEIVKSVPMSSKEYGKLVYFRLISQLINGQVSITGWKPISVGDHVKFSGPAPFGKGLRARVLDIGGKIIGNILDKLLGVFGKFEDYKYYIPVPDDNVFYVMGKIYQAEIMGANNYREEMFLHLGYGGTEFMEVAPPLIKEYSIVEG